MKIETKHRISAYLIDAGHDGRGYAFLAFRKKETTP